MLRVNTMPMPQNLTQTMIEGQERLEDDAELLEAACRFDQAALTEIHNRYYRSLYRYVNLKVSDALEAEDLTSEVFSRFLKALKHGKAPKKSIRGWLFSVASNVVNDYYRRHYRVEHVALNEGLSSSDTGPMEAVSKIMRREAIITAMKSLTQDQQDVIALRFGAGLSVRETARSLHKTEGAVKQLQARAIANLTNRLNDDGDSE